ncbi:MAG TPA: APC family permease, partial [Jatrophihabitans sp.]|nr:APC family permease [Jatrophihabitans sp.]
ALVLFVFFIVVIAKVGADNNVAKAFNPNTSPAGISGVLFGVIYAVLLFTGFETAANLAEETARPKRDIPRAVIWSVGIASVFFLIASYSQVAGFDFNADKMLKAVQSGVPPLIVLGGPGSAGGYGSVFVRRLLEFIVIMDMLAVYIGCAVAASRGTFALARDRWLPTPLATVSRRRGTPFGATIMVIAVYLVWILLQHVAPSLFEMPETPAYFSFYFWLSGFGIFALLVVYLLVCVGAPRGLRDHATPVTVWICTVLGAALACGAIFGAFYKVTAPLVWTGWTALILFAVALIVSFVVGRGRTLADLHSGEEDDSIVAVREHPIYHAHEA